MIQHIDRVKKGKADRGERKGGRVGRQERGKAGGIKLKLLLKIV